MSTVPIPAQTTLRPNAGQQLMGKDTLIVPVHGRSPWFLPAVLLMIMLALTLALWRAEIRLDVNGVSRSSTWVLWGGLGTSLAFSVAIGMVLWQRDQEQLQARRHLEALESLHAITSATSVEIRAGPRVLRQLAESARSLMCMDRAGVLLFDTETRLLRMLASAGELPGALPEYFPVDGLPACARCIEQGEVVLSENAAPESIGIGTQNLHFFKARSMILIPLSVAGQRVGLMSFGNLAPRSFTPSDKRLAELLGAQASVILANTSLCEEMRAILVAQKRLLEQREAIAAANAAIYAAPNLREGLQRLCEIVHPALDVDLCGVVLKSADGSILEAVTPRIGMEIGETISTPNALAEQMYATAATVVVKDSDTDPRLHPSWRKIRRLGSLLAIPMFDAHRRPLGALVLVRYQKGDFSRGQRELSQILADRAGAAIENSRLLEQTRRDADTKEVLLRELNHRVKNNLAGIVGLLSIGEPDMPLPTRRWLDRVIERVRILAGAHELFAGGVATAGLSDLVEKVLPSLSVVRPSTVLVRKELNVEARLDPQSAVGLGMVLHELCFNAIVHGMPEGGLLTVRSRKVDKDRVALDVVDTGRPFANVPDPAGTGLGLRLVKGLVTRELRGTFTSTAGEGGGTIATVEFPVQMECSPRKVLNSNGDVNDTEVL